MRALENVYHTWAPIEVWSRQGATQIHVYLYLTHLHKYSVPLGGVRNRQTIFSLVISFQSLHLSPFLLFPNSPFSYFPSSIYPISCFYSPVLSFFSSSNPFSWWTYLSQIQFVAGLQAARLATASMPAGALHVYYHLVFVIHTRCAKNRTIFKTVQLLYVMQRIFKYNDIQNIDLTPEKELYILIYWTSSYVIIYRSYTLLKTVLFLAHPVLYCS